MVVFVVGRGMAPILSFPFKEMKPACLKPHGRRDVCSETLGYDALFGLVRQSSVALCWFPTMSMICPVSEDGS